MRRPGTCFLRVSKEGEVRGPLRGLKNRLAEFARVQVPDVRVMPNGADAKGHGGRHEALLGAGASRLPEAGCTSCSEARCHEQESHHAEAGTVRFKPCTELDAQPVRTFRFSGALHVAVLSARKSLEEPQATKLAGRFLGRLSTGGARRARRASDGRSHAPHRKLRLLLPFQAVRDADLSTDCAVNGHMRLNGVRRKAVWRRFFRRLGECFRDEERRLQPRQPTKSGVIRVPRMRF